VIPVRIHSAACLLLVATAAQADVTIVSRSEGRDLGSTSVGETVTYLQGLRMRTDVTVRGHTQSTIVDLDAAEFVALDHRSRRAEIRTLRRRAPDSGTAPNRRPTMTLTPTGERQERLGQTCGEYAVEIAPEGTDEGTSVGVVIRGSVSIGTAGAAVQAWTAFHAAAAARAIVPTDPRVVDADPVRARAISILNERIAKVGLPYVMQVQISAEGRGDGSDRLRAMGTSSLRTEIVRIDHGPLPGDTFTIPAGYAVTRN
jgi:hypothetical protein